MTLRMLTEMASAKAPAGVEPRLVSLPAWLAHQARHHPHAVALRHKRHGGWNAMSWRDAHHAVRCLAYALARRGFGAGDGLVMLSTHPCPPAAFVALAAQWLGGVAIAIDPLDQRAALPAILRHLQARFVLVDDDRSANLIRELDADRRVALVVQTDTRGVAPVGDWPLLGYEALVAEGEVVAGAAEEPANDDQAASAGLAAPLAAGHDTAFVFCRPGEEGGQKGPPLVHRLTHHDLLRHARQLVDSERLDANDETFVSRSFATAGHARYVIAPWLLAGFRLNFPESLSTRDRDRREIAPTVLVGTSASYARLARLVHDELSPPSSWRCRTTTWALGRSGGGLASLVAALLVHRPLRDLLGLARTRVPLLVGEPTNAMTQALFDSLGLALHPLPDPADFRPTVELRRAGDPAPGWRWHDPGALVGLSGGGAQ